MTFEEIIRSFAISDTVPEQAINAALAEPAAFVDKAVALLEEVTAGTATEQQEQGVCVLAHVLGEIGDRRAFGPLLKVLALPGSGADKLFGDAMTGSMVSILISLMVDDQAALERMVLDAGVDPFARDSCFRAWTYAALSGRIERDRAHDFLAQYLQRAKLKRGDFGLSSWTDAVTSLRFADLTGLARKHLPVRILGRPIWKQPATTFEDFEHMLAEADRNPDGWRDERFLHPFESTVAELSTWYGYSEKFRQERADRAARAELREDYAELGLLDEPRGATNPYRDVGRNDPCPCGSGRKFKKCCLK